MGFNIEMRERHCDTLFTVRQFATRVWEHPLLTEQTRIHRLASRKNLTELMDSQKIPQNSYFALPVGEDVWVSKPDSDFDVIIFTTENEVAEKVRNIPSQATGLVDIISSGSISRLKHIEENWPYNVLYVPDEYIIGNVELARKTRKILTDDFIVNAKYRFDKYAPQLFTTFFRDWALHNPWYENSNPLTSKKRILRFNEALDVRAKQTHAPDEWKAAFMKSLQNMQSPNFQIFAEAMRQSNGALTLLDPWRAQGIIHLDNPKQ